MLLWMVILWVVLVLFGLSLFYLGSRVVYFFPSEIIENWSKIKTFLVCGWTVLSFMGILTLCIDFVNAIICTLYLAMIWVLSELIFGGLKKVFHLHFEHYYAGYAALVGCALILSVGWYLNHHVHPVNYAITTTQKVPPLRVIMFADSHLGTTFDAKGFEQHLKAMQQLKPDIVAVVGDYVDDDTKKEEMIQATRALGQMKTKYGIYFVWGNHDKGYYGPAHRGFSGRDLLKELKKMALLF